MADDRENWKNKAAEEVTEERRALLNHRKRLIADHQQELRRIDGRLSELTVSARTLNLPVDWLNEDQGLVVSPSEFFTVHYSHRKMPEPLAKPKPFKDRALELLVEAYPEPLKAADIRKQIEAETRTKYHEKTAGMSLYRLSQDDLVRREGKDLWFYVPEKQRNKESPRSGSEPDDQGPSIFD